MTDPPTPGELSADQPPYRDLLTSIVQRFIRLAGAPAALSVARRIPGLSVDSDGSVLEYNLDDPVGTLTLLIDRYESAIGDITMTLVQQATRSIATGDAERILQEAGLAPPVQGMPTRMLLVDDHVLFREGLVSLLGSQPDMNVVAEAGSMREAIAKARETQPDLVLMDISLPDGSGLDATRAILAEMPSTKIVFLTMHEDDEQLFAAIRAGAMGYLLKNVRAAELLKRLRTVAAGEAGVSPAIARRILEEFSHMATPRQADLPEATQLTAREIEIIRELARGATNREIARRLVISENTVKNHVSNVLAKLHLRSRRDVADYVRDHGLTPPPPDSPR